MRILSFKKGGRKRMMSWNLFKALVFVLLAVVINLIAGQAQGPGTSTGGPMWWGIPLGPALEDRPLYVEVHSPGAFDLVYAESARLRTFTSGGELVLQLTYLPRMTVSSYWHVVVMDAKPVELCCSSTGTNLCLIEYVSERLGIIGPECFGKAPKGIPLRVAGDLFVRYIKDSNTVIIRPASS